MKINLALAVSIFAVAAGTALGVSKFEHDSDHTMLVNIMSDPPGASVYTVPVTTNEEAVMLGRTPYTVLVEFDWQRGWFTKKWNRLSVYSPGEICRAEYTSADKLYDIYLMFKVEAPGYEAVHRDELVASFSKPKELDWENISFIPTRKTIDVSLAPAPAAGGNAPPATSAAAPSTVMMAGEADESAAMGTVHVVANVEEAAVMVDGKPAGRAPVKLVLGAGDHILEVHKAGYRSYSNNIAVKARSQVAVKVTLAPSESAP